MGKITIILCVLLCPPFVFCWDASSLDTVLTALHKGISWFDRNHKDLILDAITCNNIVQGQLAVLLKRIESGELHVPEGQLSMIKEIQSLAYAVREKALPYLVKNGDVQGPRARLLELAGKDEFWMFYHPSRLADIMLFHTNKNSSVWNGQITDECVMDLIGGQCKVRQTCWDYITTPGAQSYYLTHQAFVFMNGEGAGCWKGDLYKRVNHETHRICTNLLYEALYETQNHVPLEYNNLRMDIFMERLGFCGMLGFPQIAQPNWLRKLLSWHIKPDGCWGYLNLDNTDPKPAYSFLPGVKCDDHMTSVGSIAMTQFVRYIIENYYNKGYPH